MTRADNSGTSRWEIERLIAGESIEKTDPYQELTYDEIDNSLLIISGVYYLLQDILHRQRKTERGVYPS